MNISLEWLLVALMFWQALITWRLLSLELDAKRAPTHSEMTDLRQQIGGLVANMARMEERTESMQAQMAVIYEHVLKDEKS